MAIIETRVEGLKELNRALKMANAELPKQMRLALNEAADLIVQGAVPNIPTRTGRARRSVRAASTRTLSRVAGGSNRVPYYPWLDFGGRVGRARGVDRQFRKRGRYIYKAYFRAKESGEFEGVLEEAVRRVLKAATLEEG